jgi:hypothetical protein
MDFGRKSECMFPIHRLAIRGFLIEDLRTYNGGWTFLVLITPLIANDTRLGINH